ncbi:DUF397 domain-containing protein [Spirillospora sp. NPDC048819]|uniref:DUF397 domain-containing protein n=1 Tax=Spirillospora sp. NPDC048819 TaxID=3155268 RepID=UPI0034062A74
MIEWRKSSRSNASGEECVEVAVLAEGCGIRDSKAPEAGHLTLSAVSFERFLTRVKLDELDVRTNP